MELIVKWVKNVIFLIMITTFLMLFLPNSEIKKYVKVIMGFFIISVFISPFTNLFNNDVDSIYEFIPEENIQKDWEELESEGKNIEESNNQYLKNNYQTQIKDRIKEYLDFEFPDYKKEVAIKTDHEFEIEKVEINLFKDQIQNIEIEPVDIDSDNEIQNQNEEKMNREEEQLVFEIQNKIGNTFQIPSSRIEINILNRGEEIENNQ